MRTTVYILAGLGLIAAATPAWGDTAARAVDPAVTEARRFNADARRAFNLGQFKRAADLYEKAYRLRPAPAFLINLAQCHKRVGTLPHLKRAVFYFRSYVNNSQLVADPAGIEQEIAALKARIKAMEARTKRATPFYKKWWFWTAVGVVATGATVGTIVALQPADEEPYRGNATPGLFRLP